MAARILGLDLTNPIALASFPVAGTAAAILFEMGFCSFHGIPASLIVLSASRIMCFILLFAVLITVCQIYFMFAFGMAHRGKSLLEQALGLAMLFGLLFFVPWVFIGYPRWIVPMPILLLAALPLALVVIDAALGARRAGIPVLQYAIFGTAKIDGGSQKSSEDNSGIISGVPGLFFLAVGMFYSVGYRYADFYTGRFVDLSNRERALVVVYGANWIFRAIDPKTGDFTDELEIVSGGEAERIRLLGSPTRPAVDQGGSGPTSDDPADSNAASSTPDQVPPVNLGDSAPSHDSGDSVKGADRDVKPPQGNLGD